MFKILLVDDFFVERETMKEIIETAGLPLEIVGEAANGLEALEIMKQHTVDFVITDIEMPFMSGILFAETIQNLYPDIKIIFITLYDKFEYARRALQLGAVSFIMKPLEPDEVIAALAKHIDAKQKEEKTREETYALQRRLDHTMPLVLEQFSKDLLLGIIVDPDVIQQQLVFFKRDFHRSSFIVLVIEIEKGEDRFSNQYHAERQTSWGLTLIQTAFVDQFEYLACQIDSAHWGIILSGHLTDEDEVHHPYNHAQNLISVFQNYGISISIGVSSAYSTLFTTHEMYQQARLALRHKFSLGNGQIINFHEIKAIPVKTYPVQMTETQPSLRELLYKGNEEDAEKFLCNIFTAFERGIPAQTVKNTCFNLCIQIQVLLNDLNLSIVNVFPDEYWGWETLVQLDTLQQVKIWMYDVLCRAMRLVQNHYEKTAHSLITYAHNYIVMHCDQPITIRSIADHLHYSANYLNNLFKQKTGETLLAYMTRIRVDKAKKLLIEAAPGTKMYEIANAVGYSHESYFRDIFRKHTGLTPKEYRQKVKGRIECQDCS